MGSDKQRSAEENGFVSRVWRSIFRRPLIPRDDRDRKWLVFNTLVLHLRPLKVPARTIRFSHTFGLGGMSLVLILLLMGSGILLMFGYEPAPDAAYDSVNAFQDEVLFGKLVRGVHYWSANLVIVVMTLHLLRVFFTGGYHGPRQFNWIVGLGLLILVLGSNFTGYLLPWDQLAYWAVTIVTGMVEYVPVAGASLQRVIRGGPEIGTATLIIFYTVHTTVLPVLLVTGMALHFWRVRKAGGVVDPMPSGEATPEDDGRPERVLFLPSLLVRETAVALALTALVLVVAIGLGAPLGEPANPGMSPDPAKAPWYFLGLQELLFHFHPLFAVVLIPSLALAALALLPYLRFEPALSGPWFLTARGRRMGAVAAAAGLLLAPLWIVIDEWLIDTAAWLPGVPAVLRDGLFPFGLLLAASVAFHVMLRRRFDAHRGESVQALFILLATALLVMTVTGIWFRGSGMALTWPWNL